MTIMKNEFIHISFETMDQASTITYFGNLH